MADRCQFQSHPSLLPYPPSNLAIDYQPLCRPPFRVLRLLARSWPTHIRFPQRTELLDRPTLPPTLPSFPAIRSMAMVRWMKHSRPRRSLLMQFPHINLRVIRAHPHFGAKPAQQVWLLSHGGCQRHPPAHPFIQIIAMVHPTHSRGETLRTLRSYRWCTTKKGTPL